MADFQGYLLKIGGNKVPGRFTQSYTATPNQVQDIDSYQDVDGYLHREILPHTRTKIEFTTPHLWLEDKITLQSFFPNRLEEPKITVEYWDDETNTYKIGEFYTPDIQYKVYRTKETDLQYYPIRIALIEY